MRTLQFERQLLENILTYLMYILSCFVGSIRYRRFSGKVRLLTNVRKRSGWLGEGMVGRVDNQKMQRTKQFSSAVVPFPSYQLEFLSYRLSGGVNELL